MATRDQTLGAAVTEREASIIRKAARIVGVSPSTLLRRAALRRAQEVAAEVRRQHDRQDRELQTEETA